MAVAVLGEERGSAIVSEQASLLPEMTDQGQHSQPVLDSRNAAFWDELCGSAMARELGITDASSESLERFDHEFLSHYPYLLHYLDHPLRGAEVLEIGLGYGTLSGELMARGASYHGVDIAEGPVEMARHRWRLAGGENAAARVVQGSALALPFADQQFDYVFTIGCLHHTGDLSRAVHEVHRVLRPGGSAVVMLYNLHSYRQFRNRRRSRKQMAAMYDTNAAGEVAPHTNYVSAGQVRRLFANFVSLQIDRRNFDGLFFIPRERMLGTVDRVLGLDLYITARR
jgi:ubiquinone/menaquinone biosynthesis C-methylase UbiE